MPTKKEPVLVIMAAGMGSRYGGLKQIDPVGPHGELIIDYSLHDAMEAGFKKVCFIINHRIEEDFIRMVGERVSKKMEVSYVFQEIDSLLPEGFEIPEGRKKPWGTAHAILCCKDVVDAPFGAINSDDYYGKTAFQLLYDRLCRAEDGETYDYCMVGYRINNTLTDHGSVARGICETDAEGRLVDIQERLRVVRTPEGPAYLEDGTDKPVYVPHDNLVSMNFFGFTPSIFGEIEARLPDFFANTVPKNPEKAEIYIPVETGRLLREGKATVEVMATPDKWIGVTYREDREAVASAFAEMTARGDYPNEPLF